MCKLLKSCGKYSKNKPTCIQNIIVTKSPEFSSFSSAQYTKTMERIVIKAKAANFIVDFKFGYSSSTGCRVIICTVF